MLGVQPFSSLPFAVHCFAIMARARAQPASSLAALISDSADGHISDEISRPTPDPDQENFLPQRSTAQKLRTTTTNGRVRQAVTKKSLLAKARPSASRRPAAKKVVLEQPNDNEDTDEVDELNDVDMVDTIESSKTKGRQPRDAKASETNRGAVVVRISEENMEERSSPEETPIKLFKGNNAAVAHIQPKPFHQIHSDAADPMDPFVDLIVAPQRAVVPSSRHRRAGSTSSNEGRNPDPTLRRKLGEITKKFDAMEVRYRKLHDVGLIEAKANFDKLKASSEEKTRVSNELINSLKKEITAQKAIVQQAETHSHEADAHKAALADAQAQIASARKEIAELKAERVVLKASQAEVENELADARAQIKAHASIIKQLSESKAHAATLSKQLTEAQTERTNLQAKLFTARSTSIERQTPGSGLKGQRVPVMKVMTTTAEANAAVQEAQSKVELYSDLTGLLISRVERRPEEQLDIFDCIQTGRNGSMYYFSLSFLPHGKLANTAISSTSTSFQTLIIHRPSGIVRGRRVCLSTTIRQSAGSIVDGAIALLSSRRYTILAPGGG